MFHCWSSCWCWCWCWWWCVYVHQVSILRWMFNHFDISLLMLKLTMENTHGPLQPSSRGVDWEIIILRFWDLCLLLLISVFCVFVIFLLFSILYHRPPEDQVLGFKLQVGDLADQGSSGPAEDPYCVNGWVRSDEKDKMVKLWEDQLFHLVLGPRIVRKCSPVTRILTWEKKVHQGTGRSCREGGKHIVALCVGRSQGFA